MTGQKRPGRADEALWLFISHFKKKRRGLLRGAFDLAISKLKSNYFDCDFLNMRSIFSFVASQQAWLA